jgi:hypothetical protein
MESNTGQPEQGTHHTHRDRRTRVFDQWTLIKSIIMRQLDTWNTEKIPVSDRWVQIFFRNERKPPRLARLL